MEEVKFNKIEIELVFEQAKTFLFDTKNITSIIYSNNNVASFDNNNQSLLNNIKNNSIVYCLWMGGSTDNLSPVYVGHSNSKKARQRIRNHLTKKHIQTGAQLDKVIIELKKGNCIGITYLKINPDYMRTSLESWIINNNSDILIWNKIGKRKSSNNI